MRALTLNGNLQKIQSYFQSGSEQVRLDIIDEEYRGDFSVIMGYTSKPVELFETIGGKEPSYIEVKDALEENVINAVSSFFNFETWVYQDGEQIVVSQTEPE